MGKPFITREGFDYLHKELDYLWEVKRPEITQKVSWAASLGDRSENADYHYNKRLLAQIDRRIRYLRHCLADLQVIEYNKQQDGRVFFGAYVEIEAEDDGSVKQIRIVGVTRSLAEAIMCLLMPQWPKLCLEKAWMTMERL